MTRALTASELTALRSDQQHSKVRAIFIPQPEAFHALVNGKPVTNESVTRITYDAVTVGSYAKIVSGMTMYVSGSAGDLAGLVRVKSATSSQITFGRCSDIQWEDNMNLSVVEDFGFWSKLPLMSDETHLYMDDDVTYVNQNVNMKPVPIMGPDLAVPFTSGSVQLSGSPSYTLDGSSITTYAWSIVASGSTVFTSGCVSPAFSFSAPGLYRVGLTVTAGSAAVSTTGHRTLYVYNETTHKPKDQLNLLSMSASASDGGWTAQVELWAGVDISEVKDRAKVILISEDYYSGSPLSIGQVAGQEHVLMVGWIDGDSIEYDREINSVRFTVQGGRFWMDKMSGPSTGLATISGEVDATETDTNNWLFFNLLTIDKVVHHFCMWRSTVMEIMDVYPSNNVITIGGITAGLGTMWSQISSTLTSRMLMRMGADRYNRLFVMNDPNLISLAARSSIPIVQAITGDDFSEKVNIKRVVTTPIAMLEVAALIGTRTDTIAMSRAPGALVYKKHGENKTYDRCVVTSQVEANKLSGMLIAKLNCEYPEITVTLAENNRMFDIVPAMYATMTVTASQNARGVSFTDKKLLVKRIDYRIEPDKGYFTVEMTFESDSFGPPGVTVIMPQEPIWPPVPQPPIPPPIPPLPPPYIPPPVIPIPPIIISGSCPIDTPANGPYNAQIRTGEYYSTDNVDFLTPYKIKLRSNSHTDKTTYELSGLFQKFTSGSYAYTNDDSWYDVYGVNTAGVRIAKFTHDAVSGSGASGSGLDGSSVRTGYYGGSAAVDIEYIEVGLAHEAPFIPLTVTAGSSSVELLKAAMPEDIGTLTWGYTGTGIWIRHCNATSKAIKHPFWDKATWEVTYKMSGSPGVDNYRDKWFRTSITSKKRHINSGGGDYDFPLHAGTGQNYTDIDPDRESNVQSLNWAMYNLQYPAAQTAVDPAVWDSRRINVTTSGSSQFPLIRESIFHVYAGIAGSCPAERLELTRILICWTDTVTTLWITDPEVFITVTYVPTYRLTLGTLILYNICQAAAINFEASAIDVGVG